MYTDIEGYSTLAESDEALASELKARHAACVHEQVVSGRGTVQEIVGDGSLSFFPSASDAVECAIELQAAFRQEPKVAVRIGIHIGEVRGSEPVAYGHALNVTSRIESMSEAGAILISRNVVDSISGKAAYGFQPLGSFAFKNVEKPIEIYAVTGPELRIPDRESVSGKFKIFERRDIIFFDEWDDQELVNRLTHASLICQQAVCSYGFINYNYNKLRAFVQRGGRFECVMIHPESQALMISPERQAGAASEITYVQGQLHLAYQKLKGLASGVSFMLTQHLPDPIMTFVDPESEDGVLFITLTGFRMDLHERPSFVLRRSTHRRWFDFYYESFRKLADSDGTSAVDLSQSWEEIVRVG